MIEELRIENLGVIGAARIPLGPGLTAITGETGAGKTMVLSGLALILGGRADPAVVRTGARQATAEGVFLLPAGSPVAARAREAGAELDDGALVALRTVAAEGRSRAVLGGRTVPATVLAEIADDLVTVHGQQDQARLRSARHQREALDAFAGPDHVATLVAYRRVWAERQQTAGDLADLVARAQDRIREADLLRLGLAEIERIDPQPDEDLELTAESERLGHAEDLRRAAAAAHQAVAGTEAVDDRAARALVDEARRSLEQVGRFDPALGSLAERLAEVGYLLDDVAADLAGYADQLAADPARLDEVHRRRAELGVLTRSHGGTVAAALAWADDAGRRLLSLDAGQDRVATLGARVSALDADLARLAAEVTAGRQAAGRELARTVTAELAGLAMAGARLSVELVDLPEPGPWGAQDVELRLVAHAGAPARPLGQGASGGELSRVMLALEVALAAATPEQDRPATFVFDEVDAGVGGRAAVEVGRRLAELGRQSQVVVVTHLAQVAAFAGQHLVVTKSRADGVDVVTASDVRPVVGDERVAELARMLSGSEDSDTARQHAAELLARSVVGR
ncbi:MAG TPA: DNA repair protein RecN [Actinotalea sp.]|nr:DNA repair protein RecN [Actinotalea sp.]